MKTSIQIASTNIALLAHHYAEGATILRALVRNRGRRIDACLPTLKRLRITPARSEMIGHQFHTCREGVGVAANAQNLYLKRGRVFELEWQL
jgi:hypothetical protein